ncbi:MAG: hypothetical protein R8G34_06205 [Paracoccaceae bacterium]|nr:hypothetical protein [Paracoccaceae bacterium]
MTMTHAVKAAARSQAETRAMTRKFRLSHCLAAVCTAIALMANFSGGAAAQTTGGVFYDCDMTRSERNAFWISNKIGIVLLQDGSAVVSDGVILNYRRSTLKASRLTTTERDIKLDWRLTGGLLQAKDREILLPDAEYSAVISKPSNQIRVRGNLPGHRRSFSGRGQCKLRVE